MSNVIPFPGTVVEQPSSVTEPDEPDTFEDWLYAADVPDVMDRVAHLFDLGSECGPEAFRAEARALAEVFSSLAASAPPGS